MSKRHDTTALRNELDQSGFFKKRLNKDSARDHHKDGGKDSYKDFSKDESKDGGKDFDKVSVKDIRKENSKDTTTVTSPLLPTADEVEIMVFNHRKEKKERINGDLPASWKRELDAYSHKTVAGKYNLIMYAIGNMLGKV